MKNQKELIWLTDDLIARLNHIRNRANKPDFSRKEWELYINQFSVLEIETLKNWLGIKINA